MTALRGWADRLKLSCELPTATPEMHKARVETLARAAANAVACGEPLLGARWSTRPRRWRRRRTSNRRAGAVAGARAAQRSAAGASHRGARPGPEARQGTSGCSSWSSPSAARRSRRREIWRARRRCSARRCRAPTPRRNRPAGTRRSTSARAWRPASAGVLLARKISGRQADLPERARRAGARPRTRTPRRACWRTSAPSTCRPRSSRGRPPFKEAAASAAPLRRPAVPGAPDAEPGEGAQALRPAPSARQAAGAVATSRADRLGKRARPRRPRWAVEKPYCWKQYTCEGVAQLAVPLPADQGSSR